MDAVVRRLRDEIGLVGCPGENGTERLIQHLSSQLQIAIADVPPYLWVRPDGKGIITLPPQLTGARRLRVLLEEVGHFVRQSHLLGAGDGGLNTGKNGHRLARTSERQRERDARDFVLCWLLPAELVLAQSLEELLEQSGCTLEEVEERVRLLCRA